MMKLVMTIKEFLISEATHMINKDFLIFAQKTYDSLQTIIDLLMKIIDVLHKKDGICFGETRTAYIINKDFFFLPRKQRTY